MFIAKALKVLGAYGGSNPRFVGDFPIWDSFNN